MADKEYIEREALKKLLHQEDFDTPDERWKPESEFAKMIEAVPTADVVEVVRCKECKHAYINSFAAQSGIALCRFWTNPLEGSQAIMQQDDFCSYGERKDG